jgi:hypothetical protein
MKGNSMKRSFFSHRVERAIPTAGLTKPSVSVVIAALAFAAGLSTPSVRADDTEVFFTPVGGSDQPNILFILDSSSSMANAVAISGTGSSTRPAWDTTTDWLNDSRATAEGCRSDRLYYVTSGGAPTTCTGLSYIDVVLTAPNDAANKFVCKTALDKLTPAGSLGFVTQGGMAQYNAATSGGNKTSWIALPASGVASRVTECLADDGTHGINSIDTLNVRPNNDTTNGFGTNTATNGGSPYSKAKSAFTTSATFYTAQRVAWESIPDDGAASTTTRMRALQDALAAMVTTVTGVKVGLMRFDNNSSASRGGMVVQEIVSVDTGASSILHTLYDREACNKNDDTDCQKIFVPFRQQGHRREPVRGLPVFCRRHRRLRLGL